MRRGSGGGQRMDNNRDRGERGPSGSYTRGRSNNRGKRAVTADRK